MKEPSEKDIKKEKQSELDKIAETNAKCVAGYQVIRNTVFNNISDGDLTKMNKYIKAEYGKVYTGLKGMIIDALNDAKDKNVKLVEKLLDESLPPARHYEVIPKTPAFKWTNRVFTEKSVSVRSQKAADAITKIIADGRNEGLAIPDIQKKIDIVMGFRDAQGRITDKSKKLIEAGKFTHRNGSIYETYRIARTEVMRMNAFAKYDQFDELRQRYPNARLKLIATIDGRERTQSREMNGQISNAKGEFLYPDAKYYRLGTAPAQWSINDRETCTIVFLTDKEAKENREELKELKEELKQDNQEQQKQQEEISQVLKSLETSKIEKVPYKNWDKTPTTEQIIDNLGGGDMTSGSCSSLAFAYAGNRANIKVLDFRGGDSRIFFAKNGNILSISELKGVESFIEKEYNDFVAVNKLLSNVAKDKEYYLSTGSHAAIIRKAEQGFEFLELQSATNNGFKKLTKDVLKKRFSAKRSHTTLGMKVKMSSILINIETLVKNAEFKKILEYINTEASKQKKGISGFAK